MRDETRCLQVSKTAVDHEFRSLTVPVHRASTIVFPTVEAYQRRREVFYDGYSYGLYGTPTSRALEAQIAALEGAQKALAVPSGLAAITLTTLALARAGDRVLIPDSVYEPVRTLAGDFLAFLGIEVAFYDPAVGAGISALIDDRVRLVWVESPGSITMEVQDVPAIVAAAHTCGAKVAADNTWATPLRFKPLVHGVDFSVAALSKYQAGHSDVVMGSIAIGDEALYRRLRDVSRYLGYGVSPEDCALVLRSLETLAVRLDRAEATALTVARWLEHRPEVLEVRHPALPSSPGHDLWKRDFKGSSALFSVVLQPWTRPSLAAAIESLRLFAIGASWGGTKSIVAVMDPPSARSAVPLIDRGPFVRFSIGLEHVDDLIADLKSAFVLFDIGAPETLARPARQRA